MEITGKLECSSYRLEVSSFVESRYKEQKAVPYSGGPVDDAARGRAPDLWEVPSSVPAHFVERTAEAPVPHTEVVVACTQCQARGRCTCSDCDGLGHAQCMRCVGSGRIRCEGCSQTGLEHPQWRPESLCDGLTAQSRSLWLEQEQGKTTSAAREQVMKEFPHVFQRQWRPEAMCDGHKAQSRAEWLVQNESMEQNAAEAKVMDQFTQVFQRLCTKCMGQKSVLCDGCNGSGTMGCRTCTSSGQVICTSCQGHCQLKLYDVVRICWQTMSLTGVAAGPGSMLSAEDILRAPGHSEQVVGLPVQVPSLPPYASALASSLCADAGAHQQSGRVHMQKFQSKRVIEFNVRARAHKSCGGGLVEFTYQVFGEDRAVHVQNYPKMRQCRRMLLLLCAVFGFFGVVSVLCFVLGKV